MKRFNLQTRPWHGVATTLVVLAVWFSLENADLHSVARVAMSVLAGIFIMVLLAVRFTKSGGN